MSKSAWTMFGGFTALLFGGIVWLSPPAQAEFIINVAQDGSNVVATGSGTIDLAGLSGPSTYSNSGGTNPGIGYIIGGSVGSLLDGYAGIAGPSSFGSGNFTAPSTSSGDDVGLNVGYYDSIFVPSGYVSGDPLSSNVVWDDTTINGLGMTPGSYTWTWDGDSFVLNIAASSAVPEPTSLVLLGTALVGIGAIRRRKKAAQRS